MNNPESPASEVQEALVELRRYLSDEVAPLVVADSLSLLLENDPKLLASEVRLWTEAQLHRQRAVPVADYLYHALKKIHVVGELHLVPKDRLAKYLQYLSQFALGLCPPADREVLANNLSRLGDAETNVVTPVDFVYRQAQSTAVRPATAAAGQDYSKEVAEGLQRFGLLLERLEDKAVRDNTGNPQFALDSGSGGGGFSGSSAQASPGGTVSRGELTARALAAAAGSSQTEAELEQYLQRLGHNSLQTSSQDIFTTLGQNLPDWAIAIKPEPGTTAPPVTRSDSMLDAMQRMVELAKEPAERAKRLNQIVQAAILQFNDGWLGRAVSMLDVAEGLIDAKKVEASTGNLVRQSGHEEISYDRLRIYVESPDQHLLLRRVLNFFEALTPEGLLAELRVEEARDRRRLIIALLEIHGAEARAAAFKALQSTFQEREEDIWFFQRNLLHLLRRIPRRIDIYSEAEIEAVIQLTKLSYPIQVVREALSNLALISDERAEKALIARLGEYEKALLNPDKTQPDAAEIKSLLDRVVSGLVRFETPTAWRAVVDHGLKRQPPLGNTLARLAGLGSQNLSADQSLVERILSALVREMPSRVLGMFAKKDDKAAVDLVKALAGTPSPVVRRFFEDIAKKFSDREFAKIAANALADFNDIEARPATAAANTQTSEKAPASVSSPTTHSSTGTAPAASLTGDLALFGLPALLQNLADSRLSGDLTLKTPAGETIGTIMLDEGKIRSSSAGRLRGVDAVYQLLQKPLAGTFQFARLENLEDDAAAKDSPPLDLVPILLEGMCRYDELQASCAVVPDDATLVPTEVEPTTHEEEKDADLVQTVWASATAGATARECEEQVVTDSYRVRRLLAHWVGQGALKLVIPNRSS